MTGEHRPNERCRSDVAAHLLGENRHLDEPETETPPILGQVDGEPPLRRHLPPQIGVVATVGVEELADPLTGRTRVEQLARGVAQGVLVGREIEVHGANGYSNDYPVERYLRNCKAAIIYEGTRDIHTLMQADWALGLKKEKSARKTLPAWNK